MTEIKQEISTKYVTNYNLLIIFFRYIFHSMQIIELIQMSCMYLMFLPANKRNLLEYNMMFFRHISFG